MPPASLVTLPTEILLTICEELCYHCSDTTPAQTEKSSNSALLSLTQTCRRLLDIAQPVLYHRVEPKKILLLLRTIIARPDLAAQVRCFHYSEIYPLDFSIEDLEMLQAEAQRLHYGKLDEWVQETNTYEMDCDQQLIKLTLARLPNTERLSIAAPFGCQTSSLKYYFNKGFTMESIKSLRLIPLDTADLSHLRSFLAMTPCAERLMMYDCGSVTGHLPIVRLRSIILFNSLIDATSLQTLVASCPELEHFEYYVQRYHTHPYYDQETFTWGQAQRRLWLQRKTLKRLNLVFGKDFPRYLDEPMGPDDTLGNFLDFDGLEALWVRTTSFGTKEDDDSVPIFPADVEDLLDMLPESLICLGFCGSHKDWDGIQILSNAILEGHFPRLTTVMLEQEDERFDDSADMLFNVGVVCGYLDNTIYESFTPCLEEFVY